MIDYRITDPDSITSAQNRYRGTLEQEYAIYCDQCRALGQQPISFDEWLET